MIKEPYGVPSQPYFLKNLKELIHSKGFSWKEFLFLSGIKLQVTYALETKIPPIPRIYQIAKTLDVNISELLLFEQNNNNKVYTRKEFIDHMLNAFKYDERFKKSDSYKKLLKGNIPKTLTLLENLGDDVVLLPGRAEFKCSSGSYDEKSID